MSDQEDFYDDDFESGGADDRQNRNKYTPPSRHSSDDRYDDDRQSFRRRSLSPERRTAPRSNGNHRGNNSNAQSSPAKFSRALLSKVSKRKIEKVGRLAVGKLKGGRATVGKRAGSSEPSPRILIANQIKINELRNELETWKSRCESLSQETRTLKHVVRIQERSINDIDSTESGFTKIYEMQQEELRSLRHNFRKYREKYDKCEANRLKLENEHRSKMRRLQELETLVKERGLDERHELRLRVSELKDDLSTKEARIHELEKHLAILEKLHKRELQSEIEKGKALHRDNAVLTNQIAHLELQIRNKEHELEILNMYAQRLPSNVTRRQLAREQRVVDSTQLRSIAYKKQQDEPAKLNHKQPLPSIEQAKATPQSSRHNSPAKVKQSERLESTNSTPRTNRTSRVATSRPETVFVTQRVETPVTSDQAPTVEDYRAPAVDYDDRNVNSAPDSTTEKAEAEPPPVDDALPVSTNAIQRDPSPPRVSERSLSAERKARLIAALKRIDHGESENQDLQNDLASAAADSLNTGQKLESMPEEQHKPAERAPEFDAIEAFFKSLNDKPESESKQKKALDEEGQNEAAPANIQADLRLLKERGSMKKFEVKHNPPKEYSFVQTVDNLHRGLPAYPNSKKGSRESSFVQSNSNVDDIFAPPAEKLPSVPSNNIKSGKQPKSPDDIWSSLADKRDGSGSGNHQADLGRNKSGPNEAVPDFLLDPSSSSTMTTNQKYMGNQKASNFDFDVEELAL